MENGVKGSGPPSLPVTMYHRDKNDKTERIYLDSMTRHEKVNSVNDTVVAVRHYLNLRCSSRNQSVLENAKSYSRESHR